MEDERVLCGANSYKEKYYFNEVHNRLPEQVQNELKAACVLYAEEIGGTITLGFESDGEITIAIDHESADYFYDEIEAELAVRRMQDAHAELFEQLQTYYNTFFTK